MPLTPSHTTELTLQLPDDLLQTAQEAVTLGLAPSSHAFIEDAIRARSREVRHARMRRLAEEAMSDPGFVADMRATMADFASEQTAHWPENTAHGTIGK